MLHSLPSILHQLFYSVKLVKTYDRPSPRQKAACEGRGLATCHLEPEGRLPAVAAVRPPWAQVWAPAHHSPSFPERILL